MEKYIVIYRPDEEYEDCLSLVISVEDSTQIRRVFLEKYLGIVDGKFPSDMQLYEVDSKFIFCENSNFTFYHVDEEFKMDGIIEEGEELVEKLSVDLRLQKEKETKEYRHRQYLTLKKEFEGEEND